MLNNESNEKPSKSEIVMKAREYPPPPEKKRVPGEGERKCTYQRHIVSVDKLKR